MFEKEVATLDGHVAELAQSPRYCTQVEALVAELKGVGVHVAMVFLTEMGDLPAHRAGPTSDAWPQGPDQRRALTGPANAPGTRFSSRREVASYIGLVPSSNESGENGDNKGHIPTRSVGPTSDPDGSGTHQGSWRLRKALCQAAWSRARTDETERAVHARICAKNPNHKKIATVALMRRLAIRMWHTALDAQSDPTRAAEGGRGPVSMTG